MAARPADLDLQAKDRSAFERARAAAVGTYRESKTSPRSPPSQQGPFAQVPAGAQARLLVETSSLAWGPASHALKHHHNISSCRAAGNCHNRSTPTIADVVPLLLLCGVSGQPLRGAHFLI